MTRSLCKRSRETEATLSSAASTSSPRSFAALISAMSACAAASRPRSLVALASGAALADGLVMINLFCYDPSCCAS